VREKFREERITVVLAGDETFVRFNEVGEKVLAPSGSKHVGLAMTMDLRDGCTVLPTMHMNASQLLPPVVIFKGVPL
jgi:hypothetical protein